MTRLLREVLHSFHEHNGFFLAAGLSFYVVICVVPFVLLMIAGGGFLLSDEAAVQEVVSKLGEIVPVYQIEMEQILVGVARARGVSTALGTAFLLVFATQLFAATRFVLNSVLGIEGRGFFRGILFDLAMIVVLTVLFFVTMGITAAFAWMKDVVALFRHGFIFTSLFEWAGLFLAVTLNSALFGLIYRFVPRERIPWSSVLTGSVTAALLWELAKQLFRLYIEEADVYGTVYGPLGVTVALIMWVYYSALVFVLGAELIRVLEARREGPSAV